MIVIVYLSRRAGRRPMLVTARNVPVRAPGNTMKKAEGIPQLETDRVIVTEWRFPPGAETGFHVHGHDYVVIPLTTGTLRRRTFAADSRPRRRRELSSSVLMTGRWVTPSSSNRRSISMTVARATSS